MNLQLIARKSIYAFSILCAILLSLLSFSCNNENEFIQSESRSINNKYIKLSEHLIEQIIKNRDVSTLREELERIHSDTLAHLLITDNQKKAFWINIYNAHIQLLLTKNPDLFQDRGNFFSSKRVIIAGHKLSFDDIEHGIIRSSKYKFALGYMRNPFAGKTEKKFRTKETDGRIHFALNCGAKSCPLITAYDAENFDTKMDQLAKDFLQKMTTYNANENKVTTTPLFSWFRGDFGGKKGILAYLRKYDIIPNDVKPDIFYSDYDWSLSLGNYYED